MLLFLINNITELNTNVKSDIIIAIAANKCDLTAKRAIPQESVREYAHSIDAFLFETSAKDDRGIEELFLTLSRKLIEKYVQKQNPNVSVTEDAIDLNTKEGKKKGKCCN